MSRVFAGLIALALAASPAFAQTSAKAAKPANKAGADTKSAAESRDATAVAQARAQSEGQAVNARIELTISDNRGDAPPTTKTVSILTADRTWGRIRTQGEVRNANVPAGRQAVILNVDARPTLLSSSKARVELTIEYRPADEVSVTANGTAVATPRRDYEGATPNINESLAVVLEDGKPLIISQSADPVTDRKVKVEAKLTVMR